MIRRLAVLVGVAALAALAVSTPVTLARFTTAKNAAATFTAGSLTPPTGVAGVGGSSASLTWTASTSSSAAGYQLLRSPTSGSGYEQVKTVTPVSAIATTDSPGSGVWYYVLDTYLGGWTSDLSNEASVTIGSTDTGLVDCTQNAPVTVGSGDNNGYETNPQYACRRDGRYAIDASSGKKGNMSCTDPGRDRHDFWGYGLGLPASVSSINGITVQLVAGLNASNGTNDICVQLSWDSGGTWTTPDEVTLTSTSLKVYQLGGATDTWGHAPWTLGQTGVSTFRVRITDVSSKNNRSFYLDQVAVAVAYTP